MLEGRRSCRLNLTDAWSDGARLVALGADALLRWDGTSWSTSDLAAAGDRVCAVSFDHVYVAGGKNVLAWTPSGSRALPEIASETTSIDVWAAAEDDVWALARDAYPFECRTGESCPVHDDILPHFDGHAWSSTRLPGAPLFAITGSASDRVFAVGDGGAVVELDGGVWLQYSVGWWVGASQFVKQETTIVRQRLDALGPGD